MATPKIPQIDVQVRDRIGSRYAARLRDAGRLPAVIYGHKQDVLHVSIDRRKVTDLLLSKAHLLEAVISGKGEPVLIKDVQWDHLGSTIVHMDLARVDLNERVRVRVELAIIGEAPGLKEEGAVLEHPVAQVEVECLATQIPDRIKLDISSLNVGDVIMVRDLKLPEGVAVTMSPETVLATISMVKEEVIAPVEGEAVAAEPEVIGKKLEEGEEGAEGEAPAGAKPSAAEKKPAAEKAEKK